MKEEEGGPSRCANESGIPKGRAELERVYHSHNREVNWFLWARVVNNRAVILARDDRRPDVINTFVRAEPPGG